MSTQQIFGLQFVLGLLLYGLIARWYVAPRLAILPLPAALTPHWSGCSIWSGLAY